MKCVAMSTVHGSTVGRGGTFITEFHFNYYGIQFHYFVHLFYF